MDKIYNKMNLVYIFILFTRINVEHVPAGKDVQITVAQLFAASNAGLLTILRRFDALLTKIEPINSKSFTITTLQSLYPEGTRENHGRERDYEERNEEVEEPRIS